MGIHDDIRTHALAGDGEIHLRYDETHDAFLTVST